MPEAVSRLFQAASSGVNGRCAAIDRVHKNILVGYYRDFGKYSGKLNTRHIESLGHSSTVAKSVRHPADTIAKLL